MKWAIFGGVIAGAVVLAIVVTVIVVCILRQEKGLISYSDSDMLKHTHKIFHKV